MFMGNKRHTFYVTPLGSLNRGNEVDIEQEVYYLSECTRTEKALGQVAVCTCVKDDEETSMSLENLFPLPQSCGNVTPSVGSTPILPFLISKPELLSDFLRPLGKQVNICILCFSFLPPQLLQPFLFLTENIVTLNDPSYMLGIAPLSQDWLYVFCNSGQAKSCDLVNWIKFMLKGTSEFILKQFSCKYKLTFSQQTKIAILLNWINITICKKRVTELIKSLCEFNNHTDRVTFN